MRSAHPLRRPRSRHQWKKPSLRLRRLVIFTARTLHDGLDGFLMDLIFKCQSQVFFFFFINFFFHT